MRRRPELAGSSLWPRPRPPMSTHDRGRVKTLNFERSDGDFLGTDSGRSLFSVLHAAMKAVQARIAFMSGAIPTTRIARFRLYARMCKLISVLTRGIVLVRK